MSTRWYPLYQRGNPQLRVFLPNFWAKIIPPPEARQPENVVTFNVSMEMVNLSELNKLLPLDHIDLQFQTQYDITNYLTKIYKLPVVDVRVRIKNGRTFRDIHKGYVKKADDLKIAYVTLPKEVKWVFPDVFPEDSESKMTRRDDEKALDASKDAHKNFLERSSKRRGLPGWFSI